MLPLHLSLMHLDYSRHTTSVRKWKLGIKQIPTGYMYVQRIIIIDYVHTYIHIEGWLPRPDIAIGNL